MTDRLIVEGTQNDTSFSYPIVWKNDFSALCEELQKISLSFSRICVVTDSNVGPLYLTQVKAELSKLCSTVTDFEIPAGEEHKNLEQINTLYEHLINNHFDRKDLLVALGGGVTGDMTGFAAATYLRGIAFIQVPTTLLAQVDSSVGGKTGVDFLQYKNMVGAFHQPRLVYMNISVLQTLPPEQFASGMGEVVKSALLGDADLFSWLEQNVDTISKKDADALIHMIRKCCEIKAHIVREDPTEKGIRAILNLGHTIGHAVEKCLSFRMLHGQCVAVGTAAAAWLSEKRTLLTDTDVQRIRNLLLAFSLPVSVPAKQISVEEIVETTRSDKKMEQGKIRFILLRRIGEAFPDRTVTEEDLKATAASILKV